MSTIALTTTETAFTETAHDVQVTKNIEKQSVFVAVLFIVLTVIPRAKSLP